MNQHFRKMAFTLAEVLITLGIIGIVAAMTMPSLIANHRKQEVATKLKKIYSVINQAINTSVAEYGDVKEWAIDCGISGSATCTSEEAMAWFNKYIGKNIQTIKTETNEGGFNVYMNDGSILYVETCIYDMNFYTNKKAMDNPKPGVNSFMFRFYPILLSAHSANTNKYTLGSTFEPYAFGWDGTRENLKNKCNTPPHRVFCAKLIQYDGWEIKEDYPVKI